MTEFQQGHLSGVLVTVLPLWLLLTIVSLGGHLPLSGVCPTLHLSLDLGHRP
jgi:hypothetical protein